MQEGIASGSEDHGHKKDFSKQFERWYRQKMRNKKMLDRPSRDTVEQLIEKLQKKES